MKPHSIAAFRAIRKLVEPTEEEAPEKPDLGFIRMVLEKMMEAKVNGQEV